MRNIGQVVLRVAEQGGELKSPWWVTGVKTLLTKRETVLCKVYRNGPKRPVCFPSGFFHTQFFLLNITPFYGNIPVHLITIG